MSALTSGQMGEEEASRYLQKKGYRVISRNYHTRFGEIDLICRNGGALVFVEVKTRSGRAFGAPIEAVTKSKLSKMIASANIYMANTPKSPKDFSFDVVEVFGGQGDYRIEHTKNVTL